MRVRAGDSPVAEMMLSYRQNNAVDGKPMSQDAAAKKLGTPRNNWARWERGVVWPDKGWRARIKALCIGRPRTIPAMLADLRETMAWHQTEAAAAMGVSRRTWQAWEEGEYRPGKVNQGRIFRFIDATLREFV